jgi:tetratricopeptide (TPR) repeat protein
VGIPKRAAARASAGCSANITPVTGTKRAPNSSRDQAFRLLGAIADEIAAEIFSHFGIGRLDEAIASYDRAISLDPDSPVPHVNRANALVEQGQVEQALAGYDRALALAPDFAHAHIARGLLLKEMERLEKALANVGRAIALQPELPDARRARASVLAALGREEDTQAARDKAAELEKKKAEQPKADDEAPRAN